MRTLVLAAIIAAVPAAGFAQTHRAYHAQGLAFGVGYRF